MQKLRTVMILIKLNQSQLTSIEKHLSQGAFSF